MYIILFSGDEEVKNKVKNLSPHQELWWDQAKGSRMGLWYLLV